ncbi:MAG: cytochrome c family protein [Pseudomonadota bacterium]
MSLMIPLRACGLIGSLALAACVAASEAPETNTAPTDPKVAARGKILFLQCRACHGLKPEEGHRVGPNLSGLFGRPAASQDGFTYSEAMQNAGITWDGAQLDEFLKTPYSKVPGTIMAFAGISADADRAAVIEYLRAETPVE